MAAPDEPMLDQPAAEIAGATATPKLRAVPPLHSDEDGARAPKAPSGWYARGGKRLFDIAAASAALIALSPVIIAAALAVRASLGRGVLYRQTRVGYHGEDFEMLKFRTMEEDRRKRESTYHESDRRVAHKRCDDPRHTRLGRFLRRYSLDELPQLLNVLRGDMSLVGPRPELSIVVNRIGARNHPRHLVRPGITGEWQVSQRQEGRPLADDFEMDIPYLSRVSLRTDLGVIQRTGQVVLAGSGR